METKTLQVAECPIFAFPQSIPINIKHTIELLLIFIFLFRKDLHDVPLAGAAPTEPEKDLRERDGTLA